MTKYIRVDVPLEKMRRRVHRRMNELETISGEEESTLKQMNMYRIFYTLLTTYFYTHIINKFQTFCAEKML